MSEQEKAGRIAGRNLAERRITLSLTAVERTAVLKRSRERQFRGVACDVIRLYSKGELKPLRTRERSHFRKHETAVRIPAEEAKLLAHCTPGFSGRRVSDLLVRLVLALPEVPSAKARRLPRQRKSILSDQGKRLAALVWIGQQLESILRLCAKDEVSGNNFAAILEALKLIAASAERLERGRTT